MERSTVNILRIMTDSDKLRQEEEIEALSAIYGDDFLIINEAGKCFDIRIVDEDNSCLCLTLQVLMPENYPSLVPPVFEFHAEWLGNQDETELHDKLYEIYSENMNECIVFQWVEAIRGFIHEKSSLISGSDFSQDTTNEDNKDLSTSHDSTTITDKVTAMPCTEMSHAIHHNRHNFMHGDPITDRKSVFQAHLVKVQSENEVREALVELKKIRKIGNATHNMYAYRICRTNPEIIIQDCNDDGENHAGSRLLHLLQILNIQNHLIVVSRWYGGILLGPDRFKHINNCARNLLQTANIIEATKPAKDAKIKTRKARKH